MVDAVQQFLDKAEDRGNKYLGIIEEMLDSGDYDYAEDTLIGIADYIDTHFRITDNQIQAIENIKNKPSQPYGRRY